jgi:hypothetical protein
LIKGKNIQGGLQVIKSRCIDCLDHAGTHQFSPLLLENNTKETIESFMLEKKAYRETWV